MKHSEPPSQELIEKYLANTASREECDQVEAWYEAFEDMPDGLSQMTDFEREAIGLRIYQSIQKKIVATAPRNISGAKKWWWAVAACLIVLLGLTVWWNIEGMHPTNSDEKIYDLATQIGPGREGAILKLADGTEVLLDSMGHGAIATEEGIKVLLGTEGVFYANESDAFEQKNTLVYNEMITPRGRQFALTLSDGTKVWMNAGSRLRYPVVFGKKSREVEMEGEVYFEVAHETSRPFRVKLGETSTIEVLGTRFNVNAYANEPKVAATLLEGSIRAIHMPSGSTSSQVLKPLQQWQVRQLDGSGGGPIITTITPEEADAVLAWKNGFFYFDNASLANVMNQLERWYDIEVIYEGGAPDIYFEGKLNRNISLGGLLRILQDSEVTFRMESDRKLIVKR